MIVSAACVRRRLGLAEALLIVGTMPLALVAWTALPELTVLVAGALVVPVRREALCDQLRDDNGALS